MHLHHPEERLARVDEREVDEARLALAAARPGAELARRDPVGNALRRLLLEERIGGDPFAPALHRERPVAQVRDDRVGDPVVVAEQVALRDAVVGKEHAVGRRQLHLAGHVRTAQLHAARLIAKGERPGRQQRVEVTHDLLALLVGPVRDPADRLREREHAGPVLHLLVLDARFLQLAERARPEDLRHGRPGLDRRERGRVQRCAGTRGSASGSGDGSTGSFQISASTPPGRSTRAISATASSFENQWNA